MHLNVFQRLKDEGIIISKGDIFSKIQKESENHYRTETKMEFTDDSLEDWMELRNEMKLDEWIDFLLTSIGYSPKKLLFFEKFFILIRLLPFCNNSYHILELGPPSTGKSYIYNGLSEDSVIKTDNITIPDLFGEVPGIKKNVRPGLLNEFNVVALDEIAERDTIATEVATKLRSFMTDKNASRDGNEKISNTSLVFLGNLQEEQESLYTQGEKNIDLFKYFPSALRKDPFKDRLAFIIPGWYIRNNDRGQSAAVDYGVNIHYLFSVFKLLREKTIDINIESAKGESVRGNNQVRLTVQGLLKLLYPNDKYRDTEIKALESIARFGRGFLRNSHSKIDLCDELCLFLLEANISILNDLDMDMVEISYFDSDRLYIKPQDEEVLYKIALTKEGLDLNKKEFYYYHSLKNNHDTNLKYFLGISKNSLWKEFEVIEQEYMSAKNEKNCIKSLNNYEIDAQLLNSLPDDSYKKIFQLQEKNIGHLKSEINILKKEINEKGNEIDSLKTELENYMRKIKLEILEIKSWIEKDSPIEYIEEKIGFLSLKNKEEFVESDLDKISKVLGFKSTISSSNYHLGKSGVQIIHFGHLI
jgi:hypothetical protein